MGKLYSIQNFLKPQYDRITQVLDLMFNVFHFVYVDVEVGVGWKDMLVDYVA